jgi:hypothetical protein
MPNAGREIVFGARGGIYEQPADGAQDAKLLYDAESHEFVSDRSDDGKYTFYDLNGRDIWYLERMADGAYEPKSFLSTEFTEKSAQISPNNRWVAYVADDSGALEVYLRPFPAADRRFKVSPYGGRGVRWGGDGRRLYYVAGQTLFEVEVDLSGEPSIEEPKGVLEWPGIAVHTNRSAYSPYDVSADGERFLLLEPLPEREPSIRLIQNWYEEFRGEPD